MFIQSQVGKLTLQKQKYNNNDKSLKLTELSAFTQKAKIRYTGIGQGYWAWHRTIPSKLAMEYDCGMNMM